jgi:hypothetical protein
MFSFLPRAIVCLTIAVGIALANLVSASDEQKVAALSIHAQISSITFQ